MLKDDADIFKDHPRCSLSDCRYALGLCGTVFSFSALLCLFWLAFVLPVINSLEPNFDISQDHIVTAVMSA